MPELDFLILADFAKSEGGLVTIIGGGVDKVESPAFPVMHQLGLAAKLTLTPSECTTPHVVQIVIRREAKVVGTSGKIEVSAPPAGKELPPGWPTSVG